MKKKFVMFFVSLALVFIPNVVRATGESYVHYESIIAGEMTINSMGFSDDVVTIDMNNEANYSFNLVGYDLDETATYVLELSSDFIDFRDEFTGSELMDGISIERNDGNGKVSSRVYLKSTNEELKSKALTYNGFFNKVYFRFNDNFDSTLVDAYYEEISSNGVVDLNAIKLSDLAFTETSISTALSKYNTENFWVVGWCIDDYDDCKLSICDVRYDNHCKIYDTKYTFLDADNEVLSKVNDYLTKFKSDHKVMDGDLEINMFALDDLENINYKYTVIKHGMEDINIINSTINYSSEIQKILEYGNLTAALDARAGWGEMFTSGGFGYLNLLHNDIFYGAVDGVGVHQINALYVNDDTEDTREAYISTALKRVRDYLPNAVVTLSYAGNLSDLDERDLTLYGEDIVDYDKTLGEYYTLTIDGNSFNFFIVKDSSKIKNPETNTVDMKTKIKINSDSYEVPLDAKITADVIDKNSKEYKEIMNKLKLNNGMVVDLSLFSDLSNTFITKLSNGKFRVYIPLTKEDMKKTLKAYYIRDDGFIEIRDVVIEDGYGVFETDHFSTYTIAGTEINNPDTLDNAMIWIIIMIVSIVGLAFVNMLFLKKSIKRKK